MKRAAVQWGIGRYLYDLDETWANVVEKGDHYAQTKDKVPFYWNAPALPAWALPKGSPPPPHDSIEANRLPPAEQKQIRQDKPAPPATIYCTDPQREAIAELGREVGADWSAVLKDYGIKRLNLLTEANADKLILNFMQKRIAGLLTELGANLDDVRNDHPRVTADLPEDLDLPQALVALKFLRAAKERAVMA